MWIEVVVIIFPRILQYVFFKKCVGIQKVDVRDLWSVRTTFWTETPSSEKFNKIKFWFWFWSYRRDLTRCCFNGVFFRGVVRTIQLSLPSVRGLLELNSWIDRLFCSKEKVPSVVWYHHMYKRLLYTIIKYSCTQL